MDAAKKVLYLTYDGISDPLGQSQILPYIAGLSKFGYQFTILSFEKKDRYSRQQAYLKGLMESSGIRWAPLPFTSKPPLLSKLYDAMRMRRKAASLHRQFNFDMVHCRSYIAADVGLYLKKRFGVKFFFDMRGFWADEKKDGGSWNTDKFLFKKVYGYYKNKEAAYLQNADAIISLTEAGKKEIMRWRAYNGQTAIQVIPCCADMNLFSITDENQKNEAKKKLGIVNNELVVSYLGSIGTWYMLDEMLLFFRQLKAKHPGAIFLFITHSQPGQILSCAAKYGLRKEDLIIKELARNEVPFYIKASDINISFIKPVFSKISSSPTKLGEVLSMGIPVICNSGIGDVKEIVEASGSGVVIDGFSEKDFDIAIEKIPYLTTLHPSAIRTAAAKVFDLDNGIELYKRAYQQIL